MGIKGFISGLFSAKSLGTPETPYNGTGASELLRQPWSTAGRFGWIDLRQNLSWQYYKEISVIRDAVDLGSTAFMTVPFAIKDRQTGELYTEYEKKIPTTQLLKLLDSPNEDISPLSFKCAHYTSFQVTGETYWVTSVAANNEPLEIFFINPRCVSTTTRNDDTISAYHINNGIMKGTYKRTEDATRITYQDDQGNYLWQMKTFNPDDVNCGRGLSPLSSVYYEVEQFSGVSKHNNAMLRNGVRPSGAVLPHAMDGGGPALTSEQVLALKQQIQSYYGGYNNAGNVMVLDGIKDFKELSVSNKDMEFKDLIDRVIEQVYRSLKIPLPLVNAKTMTLRNYQEAKYMLYDGNIIPFAMAYAEELTRFLMPFYDNTGRYELCVDMDKIPALEERKAEKIDKFKDSLTDNEIREFLGYEAIDGGDILGQQQVLIESDKKSRDEWITAMRDTSRFTEAEIQEKAHKLYGCH